jgi:SAM-dependent methyltransferase
MAEVWNQYTFDNIDNIPKGVAQFIYHTSIALGAETICEVGCNVGNNLAHFPKTARITGIDSNDTALAIARTRYPYHDIKSGDITKLPFPDDTFDLVFTRGVLIHMPQDTLKQSMMELLRITKKWIFNLEYYGTDGKPAEWARAENMLWYRNMGLNWKYFPVTVLTDTDLPKAIDNTRFTLVRKI